MMRRTVLFALGMAALLGGQWVRASFADDERKLDDKTFATKVAVVNLTEVKLGEIATQQANNTEVRKFGERMVADHRNANKKLTEICQSKSITLPTAIDAKHQEIIDRLSKLQGAQFDRAYIDEMIKGHEKVIKMFESEVKYGEDSDIKAFAQDSLPKLKEHLELARQLSGSLKQ